MTFEPHPLLPHSHLMTIAGVVQDKLRRKVSDEELRRFRTDPETTILAHCRWQRDRRTAPALLLVHGLTGDANTGYMIATAEKAYAAGFSAIRINVRNCGGTEALTPTLYHSGLTSDLRAIVTELASADRIERIFCVGFSMGGNVVLKLAGEWAEQPPRELRGVAAVSPPIDLARASRAIDTGTMNRIYQRHFLRALLGLVRKKAAIWPERYDLAKLSSITTLRAYDDHYVAPCFGFQGADDYYEQASASRLLGAISIPILIVHSRDDSIIPFEAFASIEERLGSRVTLLAPHRGGHAAFISRARGADPDLAWAENRVIDWLRARA
jgi:uncharacterized protein